MASNGVTFGARLRRIRRSRGLTQKDLAEPAYSDAYVSILEADRRRPSSEAIRYFAQKLGVDEDELLTGRPSNLHITLDIDAKEARQEASRGRITEAEDKATRIAQQAKRYGLAKHQACATQVLALCAMQRGNLERAIELYETAESLLAAEPLTARIEAVAGKARCLRMSGDLHHSIYVLEETLENLNRENLSDAGALLRIHASLVPSYFQSGAHRKANASATEALRLASTAQEPERLADMHMNVARMMLAQGRPDDARDSLRRAEELFVELELQTEIAHCRLAQAYVLSREGKLQESKEQLESAQRIFVATGNLLDEARVKNELARIARQLGRAAQARRLLESSIEVLRDERDLPELALAIRELGLVETTRDPARAEKHFRTAIELYDRMDAAVELAITYRMLGDLMGAQGNRSSADLYRTGLLALERVPLSDT